MLIIAATFFAAAVTSLVAASFSVTLIEESSEIGVREALDDRGMTWAEVQADGLQVTLAGIAPTEAVRFSALSTAGSIVEASRIIDEMEVQAQAAIAPPRFSAEILRGIQACFGGDADSVLAWMNEFVDAGADRGRVRE